MIRPLVFLGIACLAIAALIASDSQQPIEVDPASSGAWNFNNADFTICLPVKPPPFRPPRTDPFRPTVSEKT